MANKYVYVMAIPVLTFFIIFAYVPMYGILMAFQDYKPQYGILHSTWIGLKNFSDFFKSYYCLRLVSNTFILNLYDLIFAFPAPIIFALLLNELKSNKFKKTVQTITYMPYFISLVVVAGLIVEFTSSRGFIIDMLSLFGFEKKSLLGDAKYFRSIFVISNIWQYLGFNSIIYIAALAGIDQELYEAATIDGAGRWSKMFYITIPCISSTIIIMLILRIGNMMNIGYEKIILLYNPSTYVTADVISSFVYRKGLQEMNFSYSTAVGLFNSMINFALLVIANKLSRKYSETSLW
ncbi:MAG: ABC transporter permease subunit [Clostridiaceae bacterium]|nr:ABC transporter permease subunit [Clostridiaceae bacterium]